MPATGAHSPVAFDFLTIIHPTPRAPPAAICLTRINQPMHTEYAHTDSALLQGTVFKKNTGSYLVQVDGRIYTCAISNKLRKELIYPIADPSSLPHRVMAVEDIRTVDPIAVGDQVLFIDGGDRTGLIKESPAAPQ
jgi:hypothetical protein